MKKETTLTIKSKYVKELKNGSPLIQKDSVVNLSNLKHEGELIRLVDDQQRFIGRGYYGKQNKGIGWILTSSEREEMNQAFFDQKIQAAIQFRKNLFQSE